MKLKKYIPVLLASASLLIFSGCETTQTTPETAAPKVAQENNPLAGAPSWVLTPQLEGSIVAVGIANPTKAGLQHQKTRAMAIGRDELARQIELTVKNMFKSFTQTTGVGVSEAVDDVSSNVSKQVANTVLMGSKQADAWIGPDGSMYILMAIDLEDMKEKATETAKEAVKTSFGDDSAMYQQFLAFKADSALDAEIEKLSK